MKRIICIGNRYDTRDEAGPKVYDRLAQNGLPHDVEVIDGGLAGLDLLRFVDGSERVVFVDAVSGFSHRAGVVVVDVDEVMEQTSAPYDHAAGLPYLLRVLPEVCQGTTPEIFLVGLEGPPGEEAVLAAAELSLALAVEGCAANALARRALSGTSG